MFDSRFQFAFTFTIYFDNHQLYYEYRSKVLLSKASLIKKSTAPWLNQAKTPVDRCQETRKQNVSVQAYILVVKHGLVFAFIVFRLLNLAVY